jgi:hypothetical protein
MAMYGWSTYDARIGGTQIIQDVGNQIDITTEFVKKTEGPSAGNWALRVKGKPRNGAPADLKTSVVFYVGMEEKESCADCQLEAFEQLGAGDDKTVEAVNFAIKHPRLGSAGIHIPTTVGSDSRHAGTIVHTLNVTEEKLWQAKCEYRPNSRTILAQAAPGVLTSLRARSHFPKCVESTINGPGKNRQGGRRTPQRTRIRQYAIRADDHARQLRIRSTLLEPGSIACHDCSRDGDRRSRCNSRISKDLLSRLHSKSAF